jgi:phosphoribosylformimino-5-aminoimidazole carboxamide ribotide isomerase
MGAGVGPGILGTIVLLSSPFPTALAMFVLPVMDLMGGAVVGGLGGRRSDYRPVVSRLTQSTHPFDVAAAFRDHIGLTEFYLADLDAIGGRDPALATFEGLRERDFHCWVDAGIRHAAHVGRLQTAGVDVIVSGLETVSGPQALAGIIDAVGAGGVAFSLDLRDGEPLGDRSAWGRANARTIAGQVIALGVRRLIVLDVARVGVGIGTGTEDLCAELKGYRPDAAVIAGGGVRGATDLLRLRALGVDGVLMASALHDGTVTRMDVELLT